MIDDGISFEEASQIGEFMKAEEKDIKKEFKLEGILCFWKSYPSGKMEKMFEKSFLEPLNSLLSCIGWQVRETASLEGLFG